MIDDWADSTGTATPLLDRAIEVYQKCVDMGLGETHDVAVMVDVVNAMPRKKNMTERNLQMIGVKKISHATYETPDLDQQIEYYTDMLGLTLVGQGKGRRLSRLDARPSFGGAAQGRPQPMRAARLPGRRRRRPRRLREADRGARHQDAAQDRSRAFDRRDGHLRGPEGHRDGGVQARRLPAARNSRPRASCRTSSATSRSSSKT